jgi:DNA-binding NarL/FixJ family response regulator
MKYLIVDDHPLVVDALKAELGASNHCLSAGSLQECLALVGEHPDIDLIIYDLNLPDSRGLQGFMRLRAGAQSTPVLVLSGSIEKEEIHQVLTLGAAGYVPKTTAVTVLKQAIQLILDGGIYIPSEFADLKNKKNNKAQHFQSQGKRDMPLTPRENEILPLLARGLSNKLIARHLSISEYTVRTHVGHILTKMQVDNRAQVASKLLLGLA